MKLRTVIIDDEQISRDILGNYISKYCNDVEVVGYGENVETGIKIIEKEKPDIVFLDVEMPYGNAFDLLEKIENITFETVFVTAFSEYAIKALNFSASYYILKPIDIDELLLAIEKIRKNKLNSSPNIHTKTLIDNIKNTNRQHQKIILPLLDGFEVIQVKDIIRCQANDNFTDFHLQNGKKIVICRTLKHYEDLLEEFGFMRIHRSHLVNLDFVTKYNKGKGGFLTLSDDTELEISPTKKKEFLDRFVG